MQSVVGRNEERRRSSAASASAATMKEFGGVAISMYSDPPTEDISLEDFESFALDRLAGGNGPFPLLFTEMSTMMSPCNTLRPHAGRCKFKLLIRAFTALAVLKGTEEAVSRGTFGDDLEVRSKS